MADDDPDRLAGSSCTATLDHVARTLTFEHRGMFRSKPQKASPVIVPLREIVSVEYDFGTITGWFRISRRGYEPWSGGVASDPHGLNCAVDPAAFAQRVQAAVGIEPPAPDSAEQPSGNSNTDDAVDQGAPETEDTPKPSGKVTKAVDGFSISSAVSTASSRLHLIVTDAHGF
jgi:hypothetical protein